MKAIRAANMTDLHGGLCERLVMAPKDKLDVVTSVDVQLHDVVAQADSMEWEFDLKDMWLTSARWTTMVRQYLDPQEVVNWLTRTAELMGWTGRGISVLRTKTVAPRGGGAAGNKETRRWGSCMLAVSYKAVPRPTITLISRTSYIGYLAAMDMSVAWMLGRYLCEIMGQRLEDVQFIWMNEAMQFHNFKSLAFLLNHQSTDEQRKYRHLLMDPDSELKKKELALCSLAGAPGMYYSRKWVQKVLAEDAAGMTLGDMTYNTYRRIRRRFHTELHGFEYAQQFEGWSYWKKGPNKGEPREFYKAYKPLPHCPIETLDLRPLGLPGVDDLTRVDYDADLAASMTEDDDDE